MASFPIPSVVVFAADVAQVTRFYREVAAMRVIQGDEKHTVMEIDGFQLVVHGIAGEHALPFASKGPVPVREDSHVKVCLPVASIAKARALAATNGGNIKSEEHEWSARGFRACDGNDPEGNVIQVRESAGSGGGT